MDIDTITSIPVWEKQRVYRKDRAKKIAEDKKKKQARDLTLRFLSFGLPVFPFFLSKQWLSYVHTTPPRPLPSVPAWYKHAFMLSTLTIPRVHGM